MTREIKTQELRKAMHRDIFFSSCARGVIHSPLNSLWLTG
jgi:hypothetical protein